MAYTPVDYARTALVAIGTTLFNATAQILWLQTLMMSSWGLLDYTMPRRIKIGNHLNAARASMGDSALVCIGSSSYYSLSIALHLWTGHAHRVEEGQVAERCGCRISPEVLLGLIQTIEEPGQPA